MDPSLEEAAVVSGSSEWQVFRRVTFPMAAPSVLSVLILTFVRSLEAFEIPALIGLPAGIEVLTTQIYMQLKGTIIPDYGHASAYSVILIALVSLALIPYYRITQDTFKFSTVTGKGFNPRRKDLGKWRVLGGLLLLSLPFLQLLPMIALLWSSLTPFLQVPSMAALGQLSFANYALAFNDPKIIRSTVNSLLVSVTSASAAVAVAFVVAWIVARTSISLRWMLDRLTMLPLVFPGIVLGVAVLQMYLLLPVPVYGTVWIMVAAFRAALPALCHAMQSRRIARNPQGTRRERHRQRRDLGTGRAQHHRATHDAGAVRRLDLHFSGHRERALRFVTALQSRLGGDRGGHVGALGERRRGHPLGLCTGNFRRDCAFGVGVLSHESWLRLKCLRKRNAI